MSGIRPFVIVAVVGWFGLAAEVSQAALAKAAGGSGLSGKLSSNKAIRKQQLICDPDDPVAGSITVQYDPTIVTLSDLSFGPNYSGSAQIQVNDDGETFFIPVSRYLDGGTTSFGTPTGIVQTFFNEPIDARVASSKITPAASFLPHGQIPVPAGYTTVDTDGPVASDTHAFLFDYMPGVPDSTVAHYKVYAATENENGSNPADFLSGLDSQGNFFTLAPDQIAWANVSGSLNAVSVPLPPAVLIGGMTMAGLAVTRKLRRRTA